MGRLRRRMNAQLPDGAPSLSEIAVLGYLHRLGPASQVQLAALHNVRPQSMGATVNEMVEAGLLTREVDVADRRKSVIRLSPEGQRQINRLLRSRQDWLAQAMASQLDGAEQRTLVDAIEMLERLLDS
jgi:DNA-binding MarR family transcriptional regulator